MTITDRRSGSAGTLTITARLGGIPDGLGIKAPAYLATTANITLNGEQTIDGVSATEGKRVLVKDQTDAKENGVYDVATGDWTRSADFTTNGDVVEGTRVFVTDGTTNSYSEWVVTTSDDIVIDTSDINFGNILTLASIATQSQAEVGSNNIRLMTPLRTTQAIQARHSTSIKDYPYSAVGDDSTSNTTAIQAAFDSGADDIYIPEGTYRTGALTIPTTVKRIWGPGTLKASGTIASDASILKATSSTALTISDITIDVNKTTYSTVRPIELASCSNSIIQNINFTQAGRFGVLATSCTNLKIIGNTITNFSQSAWYLVSCTNVKVALNSVTNTAAVGHGNHFESCTDAEFVDNYVNGNPDLYFGIYYDGVTRGIIANNTVLNTVREAIVTYNCTYVAVDGNNLAWPTTASTDYGMSFSGASGSSLNKTLTITNNKIAKSGKTGIYIGTYSRETVVAGNLLVDVGQLGGTDVSDGIQVAGPTTTYTYIHDNTIVNRDGSTTVYAIREIADSPDYTIVSNNTTVGMATGDVSLTGANSKRSGSLGSIGEGWFDGLLVGNRSSVGNASIISVGRLETRGISGETSAVTVFRPLATSPSYLFVDTSGVFSFQNASSQNLLSFTAAAVATLGAEGVLSGKLAFAGSTSGVITVAPQAAAGTFNFNLPTTAGSSGDFLRSGGGGSSAMTWLTPGTGVATALAINVGSAGAFVTFNGALGTPSSGTLSNATGLPVSTGISGLGTGVATALAVNVGSAGAFVTFNGALGTPSSGTLSNATGLPVSTGISGLGTGIATALTVNVGTAGAPVINGGALGTPSSGTVTNLTGTASININGTVGATTPAAGTFTAAIANSFVPNLSTVPSNGMYLPAANTLGWAINSAAELQLTATALSPAADGGNSLGTTALGWQNLFGNTGFVLNVENGDWVATHTTGILTVGTGDLRVTTAGTNSASVVTVGGTQTLTAKTLTSPTIGTSPTAAGATWTSLGSVTTIDINGGTIDGTSIGASTPSTGVFTTASATDLFDVVTGNTHGYYIAGVPALNRSGNYTIVYSGDLGEAFSFGTSADPQVYLSNDGAIFRTRNAATTYATLGTTGPTFIGAVAIPAGGTAGTGIKLSSTSNFGIFFGSGAPSLSAAKGSLYLRSDGSTTNDRAYINTNGSTTWTALTTVA